LVLLLIFHFINRTQVVKLTRFDGCNVGDEVHLKFPFEQKWVSKIIDFQKSKQQIIFIDKGVKLPFPLKTWQHKHIIKNLGQNKTLIIEDVHYKTISPIVDYSIFPILKLQFLYRKRIYPKYKY